MKPRVYIETSVVGYLVGRPSSDPIVAAKQIFTEQWWRFYGPGCDLYISELVAREAGRGDKDASERRMNLLAEIPRLLATPETEALSRLLVEAHALPAAAEDDATHVALAAVHQMEGLLTWNCRHIANAMAGPKIRGTIERAGYRAPLIATPQTLLESLGEWL